MNTHKKMMKKIEKSPTDTLRVLCLHGYRQNGDTFKSKIGSFRKHLQRYAEFVFISAPHVVQSECSAEDEKASNGSPTKKDTEQEAIEKSWWFNHDDHTFRGTNKNGPAFGFDESLHLVEEAWQTLGPFHGILGFSQGACLVGLICSLSARGMTVIKPQFAVLAAGFRSGSLAHMNYYEELISIPSLHISGRTDEIIPYEMTMDLANCFEEPTIVQHDGGHYFAATALQKLTYMEFFRHQLEKKEADAVVDEVVVVVDPLDGIPSTSAASGNLSDDSD